MAAHGHDADRLVIRSDWGLCGRQLVWQAQPAADGMRERHKSTAAQLHSDMRMCQGAMEHERVSGELKGAQQTRHSGETHLRAPAWWQAFTHFAGIKH